MRNSGSIPAYKGQLGIYNIALGTTQGYLPRYSYILGKNGNQQNQNVTVYGSNFMNKLGVIDFEEFDKCYYEKILKAKSFYYDVRTEGHKW